MFTTYNNDEKQLNVTVPWSNAEQFQKVYECLYDPKLMKKRWALDQISVWETRCHPSLPSAIEASFGVASAIVQDTLWENSFSSNLQPDIQGIYSSAITRFVNLTVEAHREDYGPSTMAGLAKGLGIPTFVVDIRNEASHCFRPSLTTLRIAAENAMKYLKVTYWEIEVPVVKNIVKQPRDVSESIGTTIREYISAQLHKIYRKSRNMGDTNLQPHLKKKIEFWIKMERQLFIDILTADGVFIPPDEDLKTLVSKQDFNKLQGKDDYEAMKRGKTPKIPLNHEMLWCDLLASLHAYSALPLFMEALLKTQSNKTAIGQKLIIAWILEIFSIYTYGESIKPRLATKLRRVFKKVGLVINWYTMFYSSVANPCKYTSLLFPLMLRNFSKVKIQFLQYTINLSAIYLGIAVDQTVPHSKIFTVEELKRMMIVQKFEAEKRKAKWGKKNFKRFADDNYKAWPLGLVFNAAVECKSETIEVDTFDSSKNIVDVDDNVDEIEEKYSDYLNKNDEDFLMEAEFQEDIIQQFEERKSFWYKNKDF